MNAARISPYDAREWPVTLGGMTFGNDAKRGRVMVCSYTGAMFATDGLWREGGGLKCRQFRAQRYNDYVWLREDDSGELVFA